MRKVFLGGTCNNSPWRNELIPKLKVNYFNPVVDNWTPSAQYEEERQKRICDFLLYVITPRMTGVFSIAEVVENAINQPEKTIFCILKVDGSELLIDQPSFSDSQLKSLNAVADMIQKYGAVYFESLDDVAKFLNFYKNE